MLNHNNMHVDNVTFRLDLVMLRDDKMPIDALNLSYKVVNAQLTTTDIDFQLLQAVARWTKLCLSRGATRWSSRRWPQNFQPHKLSWSFERSPTDIPTFWFPIFFISRPLSLVTLWPAFFWWGEGEWSQVQLVPWRGVHQVDRGMMAQILSKTCVKVDEAWHRTFTTWNWLEANRSS